jgi:hypothetical protein
MSDNLRPLSSSILHTIGNTPMVQLQKIVPANSATSWHRMVS